MDFIGKLYNLYEIGTSGSTQVWLLLAAVCSQNLFSQRLCHWIFFGVTQEWALRTSTDSLLQWENALRTKKKMTEPT